MRTALSTLSFPAPTPAVVPDDDHAAAWSIADSLPYGWSEQRPANEAMTSPTARRAPWRDSKDESSLSLLRRISQEISKGISQGISPLVERGYEWLTQQQQQRVQTHRPVPALPAPLRPVGPRPVATPSRTTILAVGAHPDDVEIGCGGTLALHASRGDRIVILTLSSGARAGDPRQRREESRAAAARLGAELVIGSLPDTKMSDGPETIEVISKVVAEHQPSVVYVHSGVDRHQDHRAVHKATMVAARSVPSVYCYQSPSTTVEFSPRRFVSIDGCLDEKQALIQYYASQTAKDYLCPQLIEATARYWGRFVGETAVEPFETIRERITL
ncbi:MAG: PIG-L family deacetylase [Myxococcota bacterium]